MKKQGKGIISRMMIDLDFKLETNRGERGLPAACKGVTDKVDYSLKRCERKGIQNQ